MGLWSFLFGKKEEPLDLDRIVIACVPKQVDDPGVFRDVASYRAFVERDIYQLITSIGYFPQKVLDDNERNIVYQAINSDEDLRVGVKPGHILLDGQGEIYCPEYWVTFGSSNRNREIVRKLLEHCYVVIGHDDRLAAYGAKDEREVFDGKQLLGRIIPGTTLNTRCSWQMKNSKFTTRV